MPTNTIQKLLRFYLWGSLGLSTEIFFTGAVDLYHAYASHTPPDWGLKGHSYIWMFLIYGSGSLLFPLAYRYIQLIKIAVLRLLVMAIAIFIIEFVTGYILDQLTGHCPWEYTSRWNVMGYIRLDYLPAWMVFAYVIEQADSLFDRMVQEFKG